MVESPLELATRRSLMTFGRVVLLDWCEYKARTRDWELGHILYCYTKERGVADLKKNQGSR